MDSIKISALPQATSATGDEDVPVVQGGQTKRVKARLINPPQDMFLQDIFSWSGTQAVPDTAWQNFMALPLVKQAGGTAGTARQASGALKFPAKAKLSQVIFDVRMTGTISGGAGTAREWRIQLRRTDGTTVVSSAADLKVSGTDISSRDKSLVSYTNTETDPFTVDGTQLGLHNISGQPITLTSLSIRVQRIVNPI